MPDMKKTKISIVGAGPGDPELITVRGLKAIASADVILYDALGTEALLKYAREDAQLVYVGKRCGKHSLKQADINAMIRSMARKHDHIVRLKGGDPFVFGRGHEELVHLSKFNFEIEIVPGISSVTSLPLLQKVPLTRRNISESFWVLTGTTKQHRLSDDIALAAQSNATIVILMGMSKLDEICSLFAQAGKPDLPVMIISKGSTPEEKVALGHVSSIAGIVRQNKIGTPGIIILGEVVRLHPEFIHQHALATWI